jgi:hypothetical protein
MTRPSDPGIPEESPESREFVHRRLRQGIERALDLHDFLDQLASDHPSYGMRLARAQALGVVDALTDLLSRPEGAAQSPSQTLRIPNDRDHGDGG